MEEFIVNSTDIPEKRDLHKYPTIEYSVNLPLIVVIQLQILLLPIPEQHQQQTSRRSLRLDRLLQGHDSRKVQTPIDYSFGHININTVAFRRAIRYYCENLLGLYHLSYNYKSNVNPLLTQLSTFLSK
jgi:hypothetical protein